MNFLKKLIPFSLLVLAILALPLYTFAQTAGSIFSIQDILWTFVNNVFGTLVGLTALMLDTSIEYFITGFGNTFLNLGVGNAIDLAWVIIRDIFNLTFIFGLVWIGLKMILNSEDSNTRRWLVNLIMAALLVNFSLFITKFIVDFTNILATEIFNGGFVTGAPGAPGGVSATFAQMFGISSVWDGNWINANPAGSGTGGYMYIFGAAIVFLIGSFCFAAGAFMIMIRFVALCLYMVFSPLMFLGWVFPQMQSVTSKYWSGFLGRAFFAPAYIMLIYLSAYVMGAYNSTAGSMATAFNPSTGSLVGSGTTLVNFTLVAIFLIASVVVGNKLSTDGAGVAMRVGNNLRGRVQRGVQRGAIGAGRFGARQTAGYGAQGVNAATEAMQKRYNRLDARMSRTKAGRFARGAVNVATLGATRDQNVQSALNAGQRATIAGSETVEQKRARLTAQQNRQNADNKEGDREKEVNDAYKSFEENRKIFENSSSTDQQKGIAKKEMDDMAAVFAKNVPKMSDAELAKLTTAALTNPAFAKNLTDAQIKSREESGQLDNDAVKGMKDARSQGIYAGTVDGLDTFAGSAQELNDSLEELNQGVSRFSGETLENLANLKDSATGKSRLADERIAANLSQRQLDTMRDSGKINDTTYREVIASRQSAFEKIATTGSLVDTSRMSAAQQATTQERQRQSLLSRPDAAKLPNSIFKQKEMIALLQPKTLEDKMKSGTLSSAEIGEIRDEIQLELGLMPAGAEKDRRIKSFRNWEKNSVHAARLGLTLPPTSTP